MTDQDLLYILALQQIPKVGDITAKKLIRKCGSAAAIFKTKADLLLKIKGIGSLVVADLYNPKHLKAAEQELKFIKNNNINCLYFEDASYPENLKHCIDGPILLFTTGRINLKNKHIISIVGTRKVTARGIAFCEKLVEELAPFNPVIVSGFAYGTDITAQKAAMKNNIQTVGCLAHGLNDIYPKPHKKYVTAIEQNGGFVTDFWSNSNFGRNNFLKRNRIIAGLSQATIIIESAEKGGSLVTADIANSYNREVFAVPGRATDMQSAGCNNLIKKHKAHMLTNPLDIPYILNWSLNSHTEKDTKQLPLELEIDEALVYDYLKDRTKQPLDTIALVCNLPIFKVASVLLNMELKGFIRPLPGKFFETV